VGAQSLRLAAGSENPLDVTLSVPPGTAPGAYEGAILVDYDRAPDDPPIETGGGFELPFRRLTIPVNANVAGAYDWSGSIELGGSTALDAGAPYNNGAVSGQQNRLWRLETGDWRTFFVDAAQPPSGSMWLLRTAWHDRTPRASDIDTGIWGPASDRFSDPDDEANADDDWSDPAWYGPYTLERLGQSGFAYRGGGTWAYDTSSGDDEDWIAAPARTGLHEILLHNVLSSGAVHDLPFDTLVSSARIEPAEFAMFGTSCRTVHLTSQVDLTDFHIAAAGLVRSEQLLHQPIGADAIYTRTFMLDEPALRFELDLTCPADAMLGLLVSYDANGDGEVTDDELVGLALDRGNHQHLSLPGIQRAGRYEIDVIPTGVPSSGTTFDLVVDAVRGDAVTVTGEAPSVAAAGETYDWQVCTQGLEGEEGPLAGVLALGPGAAPVAIRLPITWYARAPASIALPDLSLGTAR
jgi:hypothetical protein